MKASEKTNKLNVSFREKQIEKNDFCNDLDCWKEFKLGNEAAFIQIYQQYFKVLFNYGFQFTTDHDMIQDCIQDLFIELRKNRKNLSDTNSIKKYLFKSLRRKIIYQLNKKQSLIRRYQKAEQFEVEFSVEDHMINRQLSQEKEERINKALSHLPVRQREAIYYFYYENMKYEEVAEVMNLSHIKSARNLIYKALGNLKLNLIVDVSVIIALVIITI